MAFLCDSSSNNNNPAIFKLLFREYWSHSSDLILAAIILFSRTFTLLLDITNSSFNDVISSNIYVYQEYYGLPVFICKNN